MCIEKQDQNTEEVCIYLFAVHATFNIMIL